MMVTSFCVMVCDVFIRINLSNNITNPLGDRLHLYLPCYAAVRCYVLYSILTTKTEIEILFYIILLIIENLKSLCYNVVATQQPNIALYKTMSVFYHIGKNAGSI